ncbi:hypothetical protein D3I60_13275 [Brevibacterium permense]|nr:hypothetical protein [Brevibacterium permense]
MIDTSIHGSQLIGFIQVYEEVRNRNVETCRERYQFTNSEAFIALHAIRERGLRDTGHFGGFSLRLASSG